MARTDSRPHYGTKRRVGDHGYVYIYEPSHPLARGDGYVMEHRKVMHDAGFLTDPALQVHHRNGNRTDNRIENLEVLTADAHALYHAESRGFVTNQFGTFPVKPRERRQNAPKPLRDCEACGNPIPTEKKRDARYCSSNCRVRAWKKNRKVAA